jgi:putative DNA primase/helicase
VVAAVAATQNGLARPRAPEVIAEKIPEELRRADYWLCWRYELVKGRWAKLPLDPRTGRKADVTDPAAWAPFEVALGHYHDHRDEVDGPGFVFAPDNPYSGVDVDKCRDPATGRLDPAAEDIIHDIDSYGEVSPSKTGAKLFLRGKLPPGSRTRKGNVEIYSAARYFTVTGHHLAQTPATVEERQEALLRLHDRVFGNPPDDADSDAEVINRARAAKNGAKFARLWEGDTSDYPSASEADLALCRLLGSWAGRDPERIERLFGRSALGRREKWRQREDYRRATIRTALEDQGRPAGGVPHEAPDDPHRLARLFVGSRCRHPEGLTLHFWRDEWHRWDGTAYQTAPEAEVRAELCEAVKAEFDRVNLRELRAYARRKKKGSLRRGEQKPTARKVTRGVVADALQALTGLTVLPGATEQPAWLGGGEAPFPAEEVLAAANGLFHLPTLGSLPSTPRFFSPNALAYDFDPAAPPPQAWLDFLQQLWPDDPRSVETLQEWFGYSLLPDTRQQKILLLVGPKRSGKGTIARVLRGMVGARNVAGPTLSSLGTQFGMEPLLGKTVAVVSDARLGGRTDANVVTERLLSISGEDTLTVDRKHLPAVNVKLASRFVILTNELPRVNDASGALASRMLLLPLKQSFYGHEDPDLTDRLLGELPGVLLWAVEGWRRLRARGHFVQPESARQLLGHLEDLGSPITAFLRDCCVVGADRQVAKEELYRRWRLWCEGEGREHPGDQATFGRNLLAAVPGVRASQPREGGRRTPSYAGIGLSGP